MSIKTMLLAGVVLLLANTIPATAATMNITASFSPSMDHPENNKFQNTTPQAGYCAIWPHYCPPGAFTIDFPLTTRLKKPIVAEDTARNNPYFLLPNQNKTVTVTNQYTGEKARVSFRISKFSARYETNDGHQEKWHGGNFTSINPPCSNTTYALGHSGWLHFIWSISSAYGACYKISTINRSEPSKFYMMGVEYELITPDPLKMSSGIYKGTLSLNVGPGGDIDFGDIYQASDTILNINFTLTVNHELKLTTTANDQKVALQPCAAGKICTEEEGRANWDNWMVTRIPPEELTGRSNFTLSSSGSFTVYLQCQQQNGSGCALKSSKSSQQVPVQTLLTLPENIVDNNTNATVSRRQLVIGKNLSQNVFKTKIAGQNKKGEINFVVNQKSIDAMLNTRPDSYSGVVTIIFDPEIY